MCFHLYLSIDIKDIVHEYLENELVDLINEESATFAMSIRVFVEYKQDIIEPGPAPATHALLKELQQRYKELRAQYHLQKQEQIRYYNVSYFAVVHKTVSVLTALLTSLRQAG